LRIICTFRAAPDCSNCSAMCLKSLKDPTNPNPSRIGCHHGHLTSERPSISDSNSSLSSLRIASTSRFCACRFASIRACV